MFDFKTLLLLPIFLGAVVAGPVVLVQALVVR